MAILQAIDEFSVYAHSIGSIYFLPFGKIAPYTTLCPVEGEIEGRRRNRCRLSHWRFRQEGDYRMRVLIADDSAISRTLLRATLQRWGYDVVVAEDGKKPGKSCQAKSRRRSRFSIG